MARRSASEYDDYPSELPRAGSHFAPLPQQPAYQQPADQQPAYQQQYRHAQPTQRMPQAYQQQDSYQQLNRPSAQGQRFAGTTPPRYPQQPRYQHQQTPHAPKKKGSASVVIAVLLLVLGVGLLAGAGYVYLSSQQEYQVGIDEYQEVAQTSVTEDVVTGRPVVDFAALKQQNADIVGWIQIPGTPINYPVCQTSDNDYYLEHTFLGQYNLAGAVFMDYRSRAGLGDWNTVLYGHHLKNGEMFAKIATYSNQAEFDTIQNIYYVTEDGTVHVLVALCCLVVSGYDVDAIQFDFATQADFEVYVQSLINRSSARSATATAAGTSHIYMLSTCSYATDNERTILVCTDLTAGNGPVVDATQNLEDIQAAADQAAGIV